MTIEELNKLVEERMRKLGYGLVDPKTNTYAHGCEDVINGDMVRILILSNKINNHLVECVNCLSDNKISCDATTQMQGLADRLANDSRPIVE